MAEIKDEVRATVNKQGRVGTLSTVDKDGKPNVAYFGSPNLRDDGTFVVGLAQNRTLNNLKANPNAVFFCVEGSPVTFTTPGYRLYLKVRDIETEGANIDGIRAAIAKVAGEDAAKGLKAAVLFDVTEVRPLIAMG